MEGPFGALFLEYSTADLPLDVLAEITPALHAVSVPAPKLLVFYADGLSEHGHKPIEGKPSYATRQCLPTRPHIWHRPA
jgi:hypothetical protein